ncbi:MAG: glycosyltransferase [Candidatus Bathyarchaeia archaeon]|jgi:cellulose synthase/poly-beta-1,6-N-acetylglucosamine synthase-like glycosyltransferase
MSQSVVLPENIRLDVGFSIGICAADSAANLERLLDLIETESYPSGLMLKKVVLVASGCDASALLFARELARRDRRFVLIEEPIRRGKSVAINQIIQNFDGQFLVLVNSDALPERGAISRLLNEIMRDEKIGMVSGLPIVSGGAGLAGSVLELMWGVHNEFLRELNVDDLNNRCCDELLVLRGEALHELPPDTVNDGAYLAGTAYLAGYTIGFCQTAKVKIDVPKNFVDVIRQRRRIVYGHLQIWKKVGKSPKTLESMLASNPVLSLSILIRTLSDNPRLIIALPVSMIGEVVSVFLAMLDNVGSTRKHALWKRYGTKS